MSPLDVSGTAWKDAVVELVVRYQDLDILLQEVFVSDSASSSHHHHFYNCS